MLRGQLLRPRLSEKPVRPLSQFFFMVKIVANFMSRLTLCEPFRMAMLVHEAINKFGKTVEIEIGEPLTWERLADRGGRQQLTDYLYQQVQSLRN